MFHALIWTGKSQRTGIYHLALSSEMPSGSEPKPLGDPTASHPDLASNHEGQLAAVWDSRSGNTPAIWSSLSTDGGKSWNPPRRLSATEASATHPRVVATSQGFRALWTEARSGKSTAWATALLP